MRFLVGTMTIGLSAFLLEMFFPWWVISVAGFLGGFLFYQKGGLSFLSGFAGIFLFWAVSALLLDVGNDFILSARIATLLQLPVSFSLIPITGIVGGLVGGFSSLTGTYFSAALKVDRKSKY